MATELKKGDKVVVATDNHVQSLHDRTGVVVEVTEHGSVDVVFKGWNDPRYGHSGNALDGSTNHRWFYKTSNYDGWKHLTVVPPKPKATKKPSQAYKGNGNHEWERSAYQTSRLRVPGGYLYLYTGINNTMAFVPMPEVVKHKV